MARDDNFSDLDNPYAAPETFDFEDDKEEGSSGRVVYATFWARFAAVFLDGIICNVFLLIFGFTIGFAMAAGGEDPSAGGPQMTLNIIGMIMQWLYMAGFTSSSYMATPGKMAIGIKVTDLQGNRISFGKASGRYFGKILSGITLGIGYLMQPFTERKQALHDLVAGTLVVKK